ncbi:hypothetical protein WHU11_26335 (plasmid) [Escherichia coli]
MLTDTFDIALPVNQSFDVWQPYAWQFRLYIATLLSALNLLVRWGCLLVLMQHLSSNSCRSDFFQPAEDYIQTPYVHYIGTLFG